MPYAAEVRFLFLSAVQRFRLYYQPLIHYISPFYKSLSTDQNCPKRFWRLSIEDLICFFAMIFATLTIWIAVIFAGSYKSVVCYWDGPNYVYAAITLYEIPKTNPWTKYFKYDPSYFACHLPGFPLVIRFFAFFTVGNYYIADILAIIFCSLLLSYAFRRLLVAYNCVVNPTFTTVMLAFVPMRLVIYHCVGASEPLFIAEICFVLIFYKYEMHGCLLLAIWASCVTRIEGMAVGAAVGLCYLMKMDLSNAVKMFLTFIAPAFLMVFHRSMFGNAMAYIDFNKGRQKLIGWPPMPEISSGRVSSNNVNYLHSFIDFYPLYLIGTVLVLLKAGPIGIFSFGYLMYVSLLRHMDLYRYSLPVGVFAVLIGFDELWTHPYTRFAFKVIGPFYWLEMMIYAAGQIHSNRCSDNFINEVMKATKDVIH